uniref:NOB1_Zn_bind domain-containing protein n=1 Tax=Strongyloides papillosus TaxID=174720 RepID=A0A0N5BK03_STREA
MTLYNGKPAEGAIVSVEQSTWFRIPTTLAKIICDRRGCFIRCTNKYLFSNYDLHVRVKRQYSEGKLLCKMDASFMLSIKTVVKSTNKEIAIDLGRVDLITIPNVRKICQPRRSSKKKI